MRLLNKREDKKIKNLMNFLIDFLGLYLNIYCLDSLIGLEVGIVFDRNIIVLLYLDFNFLLVVWLGFYVGWCLLNLSKVFL